MQEIAKRTKIPMEINSVLYIRLLEELKAGNVDIITFFENKEFKSSYVHIGTLHPFDMAILSLASNPIKHSDSLSEIVAQLEGKRLGVVRAAWYGEQINNNKKIKFIEIKDAMQGVELLANERIDAIIGSHFILVEGKKRVKIKDNHFYNKLAIISKGAYHLYSQKNISQDDAIQIQKALVSIKKDGTLKKILAKYE